MTTRDLPVSAPEPLGTAPSDAPEPNSRAYEIVVGGAVVALGIAVYFLTDGIDVAREGQSFGPRWWPTALAISMIVIGLVLVVQAVAGRITSDEPPITRSGSVVLAATVALIVGYGFAWQYLDFRAVTVVLLAGLIALFGGRGVKALVIFPVVTTILLWSIFGLLLQVPL